MAYDGQMTYASASAWMKAACAEPPYLARGYWAAIFGASVLPHARRSAAANAAGPVWLASGGTVPSVGAVP